MLGAMDVPAAAAGPWIALGAVLGILLLLAVAAVALRFRGRPPSSAGQPDAPRDDLAGFLAHPPGTPGAPADDGDGWAALGPVAAPPAAAPPAPPGPRPGTVLAGLAVAALLLLGVAAVLAAAARSPEAAGESASPSTSASPSPAPPDPGARSEGVAARLAFGGVVLEEHAVGITVAYPELELRADDGGTVATLRLPTANCLAVAAPPAAGDPACRAARTEYAELAEPDLRVVRDGDDVTVSGRFTTFLRPPGAAAVPTGRSYEVTVTVTAAGAGRDGGVPAEGGLRWDDQSAPLRTDGPPNVLRPEG